MGKQLLKPKQLFGRFFLAPCPVSLTLKSSSHIPPYIVSYLINFTVVPYTALHLSIVRFIR